MAEEDDREGLNVIIMTVILTALIIIISVLALWYLTGNAYLGIEYTLETFFGAPNVYADIYISNLAALYSTPISGNPLDFVLITMIVIVDNLSKILVFSFVLAAVLDIISYANVDSFVNKFKAKGFRNHVILCSYNRVSEMLAERLKKEKIQTVFIEDNAEKLADMNEKGLNFIRGDYKSTTGLLSAGIDKARAVVLTSQNDLDNILGAIAARKVNSKIRIVSRAGNTEAIDKMPQLGVDICLIAEKITGAEIADYILRRVRW